MLDSQILNWDATTKEDFSSNADFGFPTGAAGAALAGEGMTLLELRESARGNDPLPSGIQMGSSSQQAETPSPLQEDSGSSLTSIIYVKVHAFSFFICVLVPHGYSVPFIPGV